MANRTSAPSLRPIHAACIMRVDSGHSTRSRSSRSLCAYAVMRNIHCRSGIRKTGWPPRSLRPSMISSLASTVPSAGHQFTVCTPRYAKRCVSKCACRCSGVHADHFFSICCAPKAVPSPPSPITEMTRSSFSNFNSSSAIGRAFALEVS